MALSQWSQIITDIVEAVMQYPADAVSAGQASQTTETVNAKESALVGADRETNGSRPSLRQRAERCGRVRRDPARDVHVFDDCNRRIHLG